MFNHLRFEISVIFLALAPLLAPATPFDVNSDGRVGPHEVIDMLANWKGPAIPLGGAQPWEINAASETVYYNGGNVGIGTDAPAERLTIAGNAEIGTHHGDYQYLRIGGGNSSGFFYGSFPAFGDGIHFGYNYYADSAGNDRGTRIDGGTSRISTGYGSVSFATRDVGGAPPVDRLVVDSAGNVRLGQNTQLFLPGGEENLRMIRGVVAEDGSIISGSGFTVTKTNVGSYTITFTSAFSGPPSVTATAHGDRINDTFVVTAGVLNTHVNLEIVDPSNSTTAQLYDDLFNFLAVGPR